MIVFPSLSIPLSDRTYNGLAIRGDPDSISESSQTAWGWMNRAMSTSNPSTETTSNPIVSRPVVIPVTQPNRYISFMHALNLRFPEEDTGDWHFEPAFFDYSDRPPRDRPIPVAGIGEAVDTTPSLGTKGVRDMAKILIQSQIPIPPGQAVYVANHYRAIADLAMLELQKGHQPRITTNSTINSWLDTSEQIEQLKQEYLAPLRQQLSGPSLAAFEDWILTVFFD
jgi:hypothetical protein